MEAPGSGDPIRSWGRLQHEGKTLWWPIMARNKKSVSINLRAAEGQELERIRGWGKKVVMVLNKADILDSDAALEEIRTFVLQHATQVLGTTPEFFPVSARTGQQARAAADPAESQRLWDASRLQVRQTQQANKGMQLPPVDDSVQRTQVTTSVQVAGNEPRAHRAMLAADSGMQFMKYHLATLNVPPNTPPANLFNQVYADSVSRMRDMWNVPEYARLIDIENTNVNAALNGAKDPEQALDDIATEQQEVLESSGGGL